MIACVIDAPHSSIMIVAIAPASVMTLARSLGLGGCAMGNFVPAPTAAAAPVPDAPLAAVSATAGARTSPLPDVLDALLPKALALGFPKPALSKSRAWGIGGR